jgi:hypothetical protein
VDTPTSAVIWWRYGQPRFRPLIRLLRGGRANANDAVTLPIADTLSQRKKDMTISMLDQMLFNLSCGHEVVLGRLEKPTALDLRNLRQENRPHRSSPPDDLGARF